MPPVYPTSRARRWARKFRSLFRNSSRRAGGGERGRLPEDRGEVARCHCGRGPVVTRRPWCGRGSGPPGACDRGEEVCYSPGSPRCAGDWRASCRAAVFVPVPVGAGSGPGSPSGRSVAGFRAIWPGRPARVCLPPTQVACRGTGVPAGAHRLISAVCRSCYCFRAGSNRDRKWTRFTRRTTVCRVSRCLGPVQAGTGAAIPDALQHAVARFGLARSHESTSRVARVRGRRPVFSTGRRPGRFPPMRRRVPAFARR